MKNEAQDVMSMYHVCQYHWLVIPLQLDVMHSGVIWRTLSQVLIFTEVKPEMRKAEDY